MKAIFSFAVAALAGTAFATPKVSDVTVERNEATHVIKVSYVLSEEGIVTAKFFNGTDELKPEDVGPFGGEISRNLAAGAHVFYLRPETAAGNAFFDGGGSVKVELTAWPLDCPPPYMAVDLLAKETRKFYPSELWVPGGVTNRLYKTDVMLMRKIIAKDIKWPMGKDDEEVPKTSDVTPVRQRYVTLTSDYYMAIYETTARQYRDFLPNYAYKSTRVAKGSESSMTIDEPPVSGDLEGVDVDVYPRDYISMNLLRDTGNTKSATMIWPQKGHEVEPKSWIGMLRTRTGLEFDLPTEAQWEYACRAGSGDASYGGYSVNEVAWSTANSDGHAHEVGLLKPNAWGLYDMLGNILEQCLDYMPTKDDKNFGNVCDLYYNFHGSITDPVGPGAGEIGKIDATVAEIDDSIKAAGNSSRPRRGGDFAKKNTSATTYYRSRLTMVNCYNYAGFRLVCPVTIPSLSAE